MIPLRVGAGRAVGEDEPTLPAARAVEHGLEVSLPLRDKRQGQADLVRRERHSVPFECYQGVTGNALTCQ